MNYRDLLTHMFGEKWQVNEQDNVVTGVATFADKEFAICGVVNGASLDNTMCQQLAKFVLDKIALNPTSYFIILVDTAGQQATHHAELIGLNRYIGHLTKTIHFARATGARVFGLVYGKALGGAFIATALNAERLYALNTAQIAVMWLEAMSRVTKVPLAKLQELSKTSAIFAPGAENFVKLGAIEAVLAPEAVMPQILQDLQAAAPDIDHWRENGFARGGRTMADKIVKEVINA